MEINFTYVQSTLLGLVNSNLNYSHARMYTNNVIIVIGLTPSKCCNLQDNRVVASISLFFIPNQQFLIILLLILNHNICHSCAHAFFWFYLTRTKARASVTRYTSLLSCHSRLLHIILKYPAPQVRDILNNSIHENSNFRCWLQ